MSVASNIRRLREAAGQTLEDVAGGSRIPANVMFGIEIGRAVRDNQVAGLARHFGVSVAELEA